MDSKLQLGIKGGVLIVNPVPEQYSMDRNYIESTIENAILEANEKGIRGKDITPFLLARIKELTYGSSLETNIALVYNNVALAAKIACAME